jgi:hypothetical protein
MYVTNEINYGHLIDPDNFNILLPQPELYEIFNNVKVNDLEGLLKLFLFDFKDWKARYLHPDYQQALEANSTIEQVLDFIHQLK